MAKLNEIHPKTDITGRPNNRFSEFQELFNWKDGMSVLDFGGNTGELMRGVINPRYVILDVSKKAIEEGRRTSPGNFIWYNRYNWMYNHEGLDITIPPLKGKYDCIWAYSVFSHTDYEELKNSLQSFMKMNYGQICVSVLDYNDKEVVNYFDYKRKKVYGDCIDWTHEFCVNTLSLFDNRKFICGQLKMPQENCRHFTTFYNLDWLVESLHNDNIPVELRYASNTRIPFLWITS